MSNEVEKVGQVESEISIIEQSHKSAILSIHENMQQLINDCLKINVSEDDKETYDKAVELKRVVKATHVSIEKKRKEVKQPLIDYGKKLDRWVEEIYTPLVNAEKIVKKKMEVYEAKQEKLKQERKVVEEKQQQEELELENRLKSLNAQLEKINSAKNKQELKDIEIHLDSIVIAEFGSKSNEAGFILNQLKLTCSMASRLMKDEEEKPVEAPKMQTTPITDNFLDELKGMSSEPTKKVVIENEVSSGLFESNPIQENIQENIQEENKNIQAFSEDGSELSFNKEGELIKEENIVENVVAENVATENVVVNNVVAENVPTELIKATDDDVITLIDVISEGVIKDVMNLVDERTKSIIENKEVFEKLDLNLYKDFLYREVKIRVGVLLKNNQVK